VDSLSVVEREMVALSSAERVTGADRVELAGMLADRYAAGATLAELADLLNRPVTFVRRLIAQTGVPIRRSGPMPGRGAETRARSVVWAGPPEPMGRVQPEDLDWSWTDQHVYTAELIVELYVQGRSEREVAAVTGYPADDIRAMVLSAGVARPRQVEQVTAAWRSAARRRLRKLHREALLIAWVDGVEVEDLAAAHRVPADLMWELIAAGSTYVDKRQFTGEPPARRDYPRPPCADTTCVYGCTSVCAVTIPPTQPGTDPATIRQPAHPRPTWPPRAELGDRFTVNANGTVTWTSFSDPA
jgi:hypothetical protein